MMKRKINLKHLGLGLALSVGLPSLAAASDIGQTVSDSVITTKVKSALAANDVTHAANISVTTDNGNVILSGAAQSDTEATTAVQIAESTKDVKSVNSDNLTVQGSNQPLTDAYITAKVKGLFIKNNLISEGQNVPVSQISVETQQGVVYLSGNATKSEEEKAKNLAKSVDGVTKVVSTIKS